MDAIASTMKFSGFVTSYNNYGLVAFSSAANDVVSSNHAGIIFVDEKIFYQPIF